MVLSTPWSAVTHVMLQRRCNLDGPFLKAAHHGLAHVAHQHDVFAKGFPKAWPTGISSDVQYRGEIPWNATRINFLRCPFGHFFEPRRCPMWLPMRSAAAPRPLRMCRSPRGWRRPRTKWGCPWLRCSRLEFQKRVRAIARSDTHDLRNSTRSRCALRRPRAICHVQNMGLVKTT